MMIAGKGDELPVSALPVDGTFPTATARWESRDISMYAPAWEPDICIQCGNCSFVCPHSVIRAKFYNTSAAASRRPRVSATRPSTPAAFPTCTTRCRSTWTTAPAAVCASRSAR